MDKEKSKNSEAVIRFLLDTKFEDLPKEVVQVAIKNILDTTAAVLSGTECPVFEITKEYVTEEMPGVQGKKQSTIFSTGEKVSMTGACLVNGYAANALDIDDTSIPTKGHVGASLLPPLIAALENSKEKISWREFVRIYTICNELGERAGILRHSTCKEFFGSGSWNSISSALGVAYILGERDVEVLKNVMGIAETHAPINPMKKTVEHTNMNKDGHGAGSMIAMASAVLGMKGFTGCIPIYDDYHKVDISLHDAKVDFSMESLGKNYIMKNTCYKPYTGCHWAQPAIAAIINGIDKIKTKLKDFDYKKVDKLKIFTFKDSFSLSKLPPKDTDQAQYNVCFQASCVIAKGKVGPNEVLRCLEDKDVLDLMKKIEIVISDELESLYPGQQFSEVIIDYSGESFYSDRKEAKWDAPDFPTLDDLTEKFYDLVNPIIGNEKAKKLHSHIVEKQDNDDFISEYIKLVIK